MISTRRSQLASIDFAPSGVTPHHAPDLTLEPSHLAIDVRLDLDAARLEGTVTNTVLARTEGATDLTLNAVDLDISDVVDADGLDLAWSYDGEHIAIAWSEPVARGEQRRVAVTYSVERPLTGLTFVTPTEAHPDWRWAVTDHETERARHWLPCLDHTSVRTTLEVRLRAASDLTMLSNGLLVSREDHEDGTSTAAWRLEQPCPSYLVCFAIGDFVKADGGSVGGREIASFAPPSFGTDSLERSFGPTAEMMEWMEGRLRTPFPYPKYFQFAVPGIGGAMENISLVSWDAMFLADESLRAELGWRIDMVNLHEMAHSYFGDAVVCRDFSHTWLKESWATYMQSVWLGDVEGEDSAAFQLHKDKAAYFEESDTQYARPIVTREFSSSWDMFDRHLYPGGAVRLHMLRRLLGEEDFWNGVADYLERYSGQTVETGDFRRTMERASGRTLTRFFDQWLRSPGYPKLKATFKHKDGTAELQIEQTQVDEEKGIGLFDLPLQVAIEDQDGNWTRRRVSLSEQRHVLVVPMAARPQQVVLDPDGDLVFGLEFAPGADLLRRQLAQGPTLSSRLQAAVLLRKKVDPRTAKALVSGFQEASHWGLQVAIAGTLGAAGTLAAADALAMLLDEATDVRVMAPLASACGKLREDVLARALVRFVSREDLPHVASMAALDSLGRQRSDEDEILGLLLGHANRPTWGDWGRQGAMAGLGAQRSAAGRTELGRHLRDRTTNPRVRIAAATALAGSARFGDAVARQEALEILSDLTRDTEYRVRMTATGALATLGEAAGLSAIEACTTVLAAQDVPRVRRAAQSLRMADRSSTGSAKLEKQLEELRDQLRRVSGRLALLEAKTASNGE